MEPQRGFEPRPSRLRGGRSGQLSYRGVAGTPGFEPGYSWVRARRVCQFPHVRSWCARRQGLEPRSTRRIKSPVHHQSCLRRLEQTTVSGWQDSNLRSPGPKPGALAILGYTPVGIAGLEPATSRPRTARPANLRHISRCVETAGIEPAAATLARRARSPSCHPHEFRMSRSAEARQTGNTGTSRGLAGRADVSRCGVIK
jgi:hypothetical protein